MVPEIASVEEVHYEVEVLPVLERIVHVHQEYAIKLRQYLPFIHDRFDTPLGQNPGLVHLLHSEVLLALLLDDLPDLAEPSLADADPVLERRLADGCMGQIGRLGV